MRFNKDLPRILSSTESGFSIYLGLASTCCKKQAAQNRAARELANCTATPANGAALNTLFLLACERLVRSGLKHERGGKMSDSENEEEKKELDLSSNDVVTKYKLAAEIANSKRRNR